MSLEAVSSIGSLISGLAVLISLVYLSLQVRQSERNQQAVISQNRATRQAAETMGMTEPSLADAFSKATSSSEDISSTQFVQFTWFCRATFRDDEDSFYQHKEGLLNEAAFASYVVHLKQ